MTHSQNRQIVTIGPDSRGRGLPTLNDGIRWNDVRHFSERHRLHPDMQMEE